MFTSNWWCRICHRYLRHDEVQAVPSPVDQVFLHTETVVRGGQPKTLRHIVERRLP